MRKHQDSHVAVPIIPRKRRPIALDEDSDGNASGEEDQKPVLIPQDSPEPTSIEALQTPEQRKILDAIDRLRNCGLAKEISLPQLVVCGDQSAGKSSVLEALTEIHFPQADNLCTRFATEIILRRNVKDSLSVKIIPDEERSQQEIQKIKSFTDAITDFSKLSTELPRIIEKAKNIMGIGESSRNFARDILSIEITGPTRTQFTVVDLPGIIQNEQHKGDKTMVDGLTKQYISQSRTICLAVITAMNDADNQRILTLVKEADSAGVRSLGIITKPDTLPPGSGNERGFINLAANKHNKYFFKLGWHVLKNRKFEEKTVSFRERNRLEADFFKDSNFKILTADSLGITRLRIRLSRILFDHVKRELPGMKKEVEKMLISTQNRLKNLGLSRSTPVECREYLMQLGRQMHDIGKCAVSGLYDTEYFHNLDFVVFATSELDNRRLRAVIQKENEDFAHKMHEKGHTLRFGEESEDDTCTVSNLKDFPNVNDEDEEPRYCPHSAALAWVNKLITQNRGQELQGNFNPLVISHLFWFQCRKWERLAKEHIEHMSKVVADFTYTLLGNKCAPDVCESVWARHLEKDFRSRKSNAYQCLEQIMKSHRDHPSTYNPYYTDTVQKIAEKRRDTKIQKSLEAANEKEAPGGTAVSNPPPMDIAKTRAALVEASEHDPKKYACQTALDCLRAIYQEKEKVFVNNVVSLIIESNIVHNLEDVFSPSVVHQMDDAEVEKLASEPESAKRERLHYRDQLEKLEEGLAILNGVLK